MRAERIRWVAAALGAALPLLVGGPSGSALAACLVEGPSAESAIRLLADAGGIGGTGLQGEDDGIGGTGLVDNGGIGGSGLSEPSDGIGGTGLEGEPLVGDVEDMDDRALHDVRAAGDTAKPLRMVEGMITALHGECASGIHVRLGDDLSVEVGDATRPASALRIGQMVRLELAPVGGTQYALRAWSEPLLEGTVTAVDVRAGILEVMGEPLVVDDVVVIEDVAESERITLDELAPGDPVVVHGVRDAQGRVVPTWLGRTGHPRTASVRGIALPLEGEPRGWRIGRIRIETVEEHAPVRGQWTELVGEWSLAANRLIEARVSPAASNARAADAVSGQPLDPAIRLHLGRAVPRSSR